ncbi:MAG TPA: MarR family transcriptional regulator, partial [Solirubrobacterales bacterium]
MEEIELQPPLFRILNLVDSAEGRSQQAIGEAIEVPPSRMVALVDELERRGFVERRPDPYDRRIRALFLTREGREVLGRGREIAAEHERELTKGMSAADRKRLVALLQQLVDRQTIGRGVHPGLSGKAAPPAGG